MRSLLFSVLLVYTLSASSQKLAFDIILFGKKIGQTVVEKIDHGHGEISYKLHSSSEANLLFTKKTSAMNFDIVYKEGNFFSSYCKNVKDGVAEVVTIEWNGSRYVIKKGAETFNLNQSLDYTAIQLYFSEPVGKSKIFSERLGEFCNFVKTSEGEYVCKLENGVTNTYRYKYGKLYELEMSKGASVFMKLIQ